MYRVMVVGAKGVSAVDLLKWTQSRQLGLVKIPLRRAKDVCPGFESHGGLPALYVLAPASDGFLSFTSSATPANLLVATWQPNLFAHLFLQTLVELELMP